jgi:UDPglucose 6-dehydrogenase
VKIAVIGVGHVGLVSAACFAHWGHEVVGLDHDTERIAGLQRGEIPFYEPGLEDLVHAEAAAGRLSFTPTSVRRWPAPTVAFVCVGTPSLPGGGPNLAFVERVGIDVAATATADLVLVEKSTVPANTSQRLEQVIDREQRRLGTAARIHVASNPEFLREGTAVEDTLHPDRIVVGASHEDAFAALREVYARVVAEDDCPLLETDAPTAELIKHASNGFLATKISFINAVANICDRVGADVQLVARGMGLDERIGHAFLHAGLGYGGSCFRRMWTRSSTWPGRWATSSASSRRCATSTSVSATSSSTSSSVSCGTCRRRRSPCSGPRSSPAPTTCARPRRSTSPGC